MFEVTRFHDVSAFEANRGRGARENSHPGAIDFGKVHANVHISEPSGGALHRLSFQAKQEKALGINPRAAADQVSFLPLRMHSQHVATPPVYRLFAGKPKVVVLGGEFLLASSLHRLHLLVQHVTENFLAKTAAAAFDLVSWLVRRCEADASHDLRL